MPVIRRLAIAVLALCALPVLAHESATPGQRRAVEDFIRAVGTGSASAVAFAMHPDELEALRARILGKLREESERGESTLRSRLFGAGMPLAEIERLTMITFYSTLARKLEFPGREYADFKYMGAIPEGDDKAQVIVRARMKRAPGEREVIDVVQVVTLKRYGKDWKAAIPTEIEAQIDDLSYGRKTRIAARAASAPSGGASASVPGAPSSPTGADGESVTPVAVRERLAAAEKALSESRCEEYYKEHMSPNFRRVISKKALEALIASCENSIGNREMLLSTLRIVRGLEPRFEYNARRAVYDVSGQGLPFDRFALELVDKRWFIAE